MHKNLAKILGLVLVVSIIGTSMVSCKAAHDVCPAYTKVENTATSNF